MRDVILIGLLLLAVVFVSACAPLAVQTDTAMQKDDASMQKDDNAMKVQDTAMEKDTSMMATEKMATLEKYAVEQGYTGKVLAGNKALYLEYSKADYDKAVADGKLILLNFYANWCPTCKGEDPEARAAFEELDNDRVIGFRVNYKDSNTDKDEENAAMKFGIAYQHTKVIVRDGERVFKSPDVWTKGTYIDEIMRNVG